MITQQHDLGEVLTATERFWASLAIPPDDDRLLLPLRVVVSLPDSGYLQVAIGDPIDVQEAKSTSDGAQIELSTADWTKVLNRSTTITNLWFSGQLTVTSFDARRADYAQFFTLIRLAQERPLL
ncbi:hypothetical protein ACWEK5_23305 [Rhodococcus koreensis]